MRVLVLGGSVFLSRQAAVEARDRGHEVTCVTRGLSGAVPDGVRHVVWDRADEPPDALATASFDAVLDVGRIPSHVRRALAVWPRAHWVFVSTISVYADPATPEPGTDGPLVDGIEEDRDSSGVEAYAGMKVACERLVAEAAERATIVRPGLIVGPGDPTGRFGYWPDRLAEGGQVLGPGAPADRVQLIDVRDLAAWLVHLAERRIGGTFNATGPEATLTMEHFLDTCREVAGSNARFLWLDEAFLLEQKVTPFSEMPLWVPEQFQAFETVNCSRAFAAGLRCRPLADTVRAALEWARAGGPRPVKAGVPIPPALTREREAQVLRAWSERDAAGPGPTQRGRSAAQRT
jgi:nucleoside-diphosphate-sugar epimerase